MLGGAEEAAAASEDILTDDNDEEKNAERHDGKRAARRMRDMHTLSPWWRCCDK